MVMAALLRSLGQRAVLRVTDSITMRLSITQIPLQALSLFKTGTKVTQAMRGICTSSIRLIYQLPMQIWGTPPITGLVCIAAQLQLHRLRTLPTNGSSGKAKLATRVRLAQSFLNPSAIYRLRVAQLSPRVLGRVRYRQYHRDTSCGHAHALPTIAVMWLLPTPSAEMV